MSIRRLSASVRSKAPLAAAALLALSLLAAVPVHAAPPAPQLHQENAAGQAGNWYTGAVPPQSSSKPVLLFVQGLHSTMDRWTLEDSYYEAAYNAGYRTAFVQLKDADGDGGSMWTNGALLASVIRKVAAYYNVPKLNVIAHSKGGIDTQTALVHYGASPYVNVVHQLSTPNLGSELADMAYGSWTSWLGSIIGQQDDAVYSLQTSYMAGFRSQTDARPEVQATRTYMSGGMGDDGIFTSYWFAHAVLPGEDDGAVSLYSALGLPYGIQSFTKNISHSAMARASQTWSLVRPKLALPAASLAGGLQASGGGPAAGEALPEAASGSRQAGADEPAGLILRGGALDGSASASFPLESGLTSLSLEVMTAQAGSTAILLSPSGQVHAAEAAPPDSASADVFAGAVRRVFHINQPEPGEWKLQLGGSGDAYFALARLDSSSTMRIAAPKKLYRPGEPVSLSVDLGKPVQGLFKKPSLTKSIPGRSSASLRTLPDAAIAGSAASVSLTAPYEPGIYNLSFDVEGVNARGERVVRSVNYNFAVLDPQGKVGP